MENKQDFLNVINRAAIVYEKEISMQFIESYWLLLKEYDFKDFSDAMNIVCRTLKFWPRPAEIIEIIKKRKGPVVSIEALAEQQWRFVINAVRHGGIDRPIIFDDLITRDLVNRQFSWRYLCGIKQKDEVWEQKRFCASYELIAEYGQHDLLIEDRAEKVSGLIEYKD